MKVPYYQLIIYPMLFLLGVSAMAQNNVYERLKSQGQVPISFVAELQSEVKVLVESDSLIDKKKDKQYYYKTSSYFLKRLYQSGLVLFNDQVSNYLNNIKDAIGHATNRSLDDVRVYAIKYSSVNAFTTTDGAIFVNLGLIARTKSEDELAFVLCHEIAHYLLQHNINGFIEQRNQVTESRRSKEKWLEGLEKCQYERSLETEADSLGLALFEESHYSWKAITPLFNMLRDSDMPPFDVDPISSHLSTSYIAVNDSLFLDKEANEKTASSTSSYSSHPAPDARRKMLLEKAKRSNPELAVGNKFEAIVKIAGYELLAIFNDNFDYYSAYYVACHLLTNYPSDVYIQYHQARAAYGMAKYLSVESNENSLPRLSSGDITSLNFRYDPFMTKLVDFIESDMDRPKVSVWAYSVCCEYAENSEYKADEIYACMNDLWITFEKSDIADCKEFKVLQKHPIPPVVNYVICFENTTTKSEIVRRPGKGKNKVSVIALNPEFARVNLAKRSNQFNYDFSISNQITFNKKLRKNSKKLRMDLVLLDAKGLKQSQIQEWYEIDYLSRFIRERNWGYVLPGYVTMYSDEVQAIAAKYNCSNLLLSTALSIRNRKNMLQFIIPITLSFAVATIPFAAYTMLKPNEHAYFAGELINLDNGGTSYQYLNHMRLKSNGGVIGANIYTMLRELSKSSK